MTTTGESAPAAVRIVSDGAGAAELLDPARRRLLEALTESPDSASGLGRRLGETRQRVNYHLRALESAGLVELQEERRRGNCFERLVRPVARRFVIDPGVLGPLALEPTSGGERFAATYLVSIAARAIRELAGLLSRAAEQRKRVATVTIEAEVRLAHPDSLQSMTQELTEALSHIVAKYHDERAGAGRTFRLLAAAYPRPIETAGGGGA